MQYASSGRIIPAFPSKVEAMEENMEGEGDRPGDDVISTNALHKPETISGALHASELAHPPAGA